MHPEHHLKILRIDHAGISEEAVTKVPVGVAALRIGGAPASSASSSRLWGCAQTDARLPNGSGLSSAAWAGGGGAGCVISGLHAKALLGAHWQETRRYKAVLLALHTLGAAADD